MLATMQAEQAPDQAEQAADQVSVHATDQASNLVDRAGEDLSGSITFKAYLIVGVIFIRY
jgi:hypothetical protein